MSCYWTELGFAHLTHSKASLLAPGCGEGKYSVYCRALSSKDLNSPSAFTEGFLKATLGVRVTECVMSSQTFFWLVGTEIIEWCFRNLNHQPSVPKWSGVYMLVVSSFLLVGAWFPQKQLINVHQTLLFMSFREELKILWLCYVADLLYTWLPVSQPKSYSYNRVHIFLIINSQASLLRLWRGLKQSLSLQETGDMGWGNSSTQEDPKGSCLVLISIWEPSRCSGSPVGNSRSYRPGYLGFGSNRIFSYLWKLPFPFFNAPNFI